MSTCWARLLFVASWICFNTYSVSGTCMSGKYGLDCSYTCHCDAANCNNVTGCSGSCLEGWSGPRCTKGNIGLRKTAYQSSFYIGFESHSPRLAVDGKLEQGDYAKKCIITGGGQKNSWWEVDLQRDYYIHDVVIHFRTDYLRRKPGVQVHSSMRANQSNAGHWCGNTSASSPNITTLTCDDTARYITLYRSAGDRVMDFCEVEVFVCAAGSFGDDCSQFCHCRDRPCNHVTGECTGGCKPNWTGQTSCDSSHYGELCNNNCSSRHCNVSSSCHNITGRCDSGCTAGWMSPDCTTKCQGGTFGPGCHSKCSGRYCKGDSSFCDVQNGTCQHGCQPGWKSPSCDIHCDTDHYGVNCESVCADRHCKGEQLCNHELGYCNSGCLSGWTGLTCVEAQVDTGNTDTGNSDSTSIAFAVVAGILFVLLVIMTSLFIWQVDLILCFFSY
ncbi:multiple epidermal growth factor-like domains protein 10 [Gigantopelta aegis]|uniref:multiple epidermal growth factor-like domains protein 10 n=1 Tax=Gigantopelta aegis TaxID=1735272 RepID=UPI001B88DF83|nr:multiple epidermal growth factor-like domains protein 10 [Gigantopelta aegis]